MARELSWNQHSTCDVHHIARLATGVGGLKWDDVAPMIHNLLGDVKADIYLYATYIRGQKAAE